MARVAAVTSGTSRRARRWAVAVTALVSVVASRPPMRVALAETDRSSDAATSDEPGDVAPTDAEGHFNAGSRAFERGDATTALLHMRRAFALQPNYRNAGGLGQIELHLGRYRDAAEHLELSLRQYPASGDPEVKGLVMHGFAEARARVVTLTLEGQLPGVELLVDGEVVATLPVEHDLFVEPGEHAFRFRKPGFVGNEVQLYVPAGSNHTLRPEMRPAQADTQEQPVAQAASESQLATLVLVTGSVLTLAALGVGVGFHFGAESARADANRQRSSLRDAGTSCLTGLTAPGCGNLHNTLERATDRDQVASLAFLGSAATAVLTLGAYGLIGISTRPSGQEQSRRLLVLPTAASGGAALSVWGNF